MVNWWRHLRMRASHLRLLLAALPLVTGLGTAVGAEPAATPRRPPNVILILTDNQGAWTIGPYGNRDIKTPNLDRLAAEGMRFDQAFANNPVCSPNRATLLTGLMPSQHGVHSFLRAGPPQMGEGSHCVISDHPTLPRILKARGYACGLVGKWHLGGNLTPQEGFTEEWVTMPHGATGTFFNAEVIENGTVRKEPTHLTTFWTARAVKFIAKQKDKPFFLYLAYNGPYGLGPAQLKDSERVPHWNDYADKELESFPRLPMHPWQHDNKAYLNNPLCIRRYAAEVSTIDDGIGEITATLRALGLEKDTLIIFTADNGWAGGHNGLWGMGDHTRPLSAFDAQMRVPLLWWQPGAIPAGQVSGSQVSHVDFLPTLLEQLGMGDTFPGDTNPPGRSYAPMLRGASVEDWSDVVYYEMEDMRCVRTPAGKLVERLGDEVDELYDLASDPGENRNLTAASPPPAFRGALEKQLDAFFRKHASAKYDLWKGGTSLAPALVYPPKETRPSRPKR
jgi:arylsulfatase A-like enzyme